MTIAYYARLKDLVVAEVIAAPAEIPLAQLYTPELVATMVSANDTVKERDLYNPETKTFSTP